MKRISKLIVGLGLTLILAGAVLLLGSQFQAQKARETSAQLLTALHELLPERTPGVLEEFAETKMPVLQVEGRDLVAVLEIPGWAVSLPVEDAWEGNGFLVPQRFSGSAYDGSLVIGGADQPGQFDFCDQIAPGTAVTVTDMTGTQFSYTVSRVDRAQGAPASWLVQEEFDLTLFCRDTYSMTYIAVRCVSSAK